MEKATPVAMGDERHQTERFPATAADAEEERLTDMVKEYTPENELLQEGETINAATYREARGYRIAKRCMDLVFATLAFVVLLPFLILISLLIFLDDPHGSPIFVQDRVGLNGKTFRFFKFRSMVVDAEARLKDLQSQNEMDGPVFKIKHDPRVTRFGRFIRKKSIDELPQLINIIQGNMSVVGPRPPLPREVAQYGPYEMQRLLVKPGLTCYWQARGRNEIKFDEWMRLDVKYVHHHNLWVDIKLVLLTARAVLTGQGAM